MVNYRYLGYGTTNQNGVAHLERDPNGDPIQGYTGTGRGETQIIASTDNPIIEGSLVSETYTLWDYVKYDYGTITNHNDIYETLDSNTSFERFDEYSTLSKKTSGVRGNLYCSGLNESGTIELELKLNAETVDASQIGLNLYNGNTYCGFFGCHHLNMPSSECTDWVRLKIVYDGTTFTVTNMDNPNRTTTRTTTAPINRWLLTIGASSTYSISIRNVKCY